MTLPPILISGAPRSGTTWTGTLLSTAPDTHYIHEPFNFQAESPEYPLLKTPFEYHYHHIKHSEPALKKYLSYRLGKNFPWLEATKQLGLFPTISAANQWQSKTSKKRLLIKDPIAIFSIEWLQQTFKVKPVILVRHPAGFVSSVLRLGWPMRPHVFLRQPELMNGWLKPYQQNLLIQNDKKDDPVGDAIWAWKAFNHVARLYRDKHPDWIFLRHEDLAGNHQELFQTLFKQLNLTYGSEQQQQIEAHCAPHNSVEAAENIAHDLHRNSKLLSAQWKERLDASTIIRIQDETSELNLNFYKEI